MTYVYLNIKFLFFNEISSTLNKNHKIIDKFIINKIKPYKQKLQKRKNSIK